MRILRPLIASALILSGCGWIPSFTPCPAAKDVEKTYEVTTSCVDAGVGRFTLTGYTENHRNDCPSGCFSTADALVRHDDGGVNVAGTYSSYCGSDPGSLALELSGSGQRASCTVPLSLIGSTVACAEDDGGTCVATVAAVN